MERNPCDVLSRSKSASEETLHSCNDEEDPFRGMEPYLVRRLSSRSIQLPPLAFRQLEQTDLRSESENIPRPTSLPLKILPLIAVTSADSSGWVPLVTLPQYTLLTVTVMWDVLGFVLGNIWFDLKRTMSFLIQKKKEGFLQVTSVSVEWGILVEPFHKRVLKSTGWLTAHERAAPGKGNCTRKTCTGHKWFLQFLTNDI